MGLKEALKQLDEEQQNAGFSFYFTLYMPSKEKSKCSWQKKRRYKMYYKSGALKPVAKVNLKMHIQSTFDR